MEARPLIPPVADRPDAARRVFFQWPTLSAAALLVGLVGILVAQAMGRNGGKWVYPLDDAYIHLAVVKHLVQHGVWGISYLNGFSSCMSSLLYPLLVAVSFLVFGVHEWVLLALNLVAAVAAIGYAGTLLRRHTRSGTVIFTVLGAAVVFTPLFIVVTTGMEHVWQILVDLFFVDLALQVLAPEEAAPPVRRAHLLLPLAACLVVMIRFEGLFFVAIVGLLLLCRGRFWLAVGVGTGAALPLGIFGAYSVWQGWSFLPNSVLMKGGSHAGGWLFLLPVAAVFAGLRWPRSTRRVLVAVVILAALAVALPHPRAWIVGQHLEYKQLLKNYAHLVILVSSLSAALFWQLQRQRTLWTRPALLLGILLVVALQHLAFAGVGWVYRYEAYLMFLGIVALGVAFADAFPGPDAAWFRRAPRWASVAAALACLPLAWRAVSASVQIPQASHNIYEQQYQMARFVQRFYNGAGVAANDIGAIDYYADVRIYDTFGLASHEVYQATRKGLYNQGTVRELIRKYDVQLVVVYDFESSQYGGILPEWVLAGRWTIPHNVVCAGETVSFYAPDAGRAPRLRRSLQEFAPQLPRDVGQSGAYQDVLPPRTASLPQAN